MKLSNLLLLKSLKAAALMLTVVFGTSAVYMTVVGIDRVEKSGALGPSMVQTIKNAPTFSYKENSEAVDAQKYSPVIRLKLTEKDGTFRSHCSAFVVSDSYAVTAAHCLVDEDEFMMTDDIGVFDVKDNDTGVRAVAGGVNLRVDYGILKGDFSKFNKLHVGRPLVGFLSKNGPFISFGYPWGGDLMAVQVALAPGYNKFFDIHMIGPIYPGMSGGPVVDVDSGEAVGINHAVDDVGVLITPMVEIFKGMKIPVGE